MSFTGKTTFAGGPTLPELVEDVADLVAVVSPTETPLLDALGDASRVCRSVLHEWMEDTSLPDHDEIDTAISGTQLAVTDGTRFRVGDQIRLADESGFEGEIMLVLNVAGNTIAVDRGYGGTTEGPEPSSGDTIVIIGSAALEGEDAGDARFNVRARASNVTQIFSATVSVSGTEQAV
ncbi:MAG: DUF5309 family protein, partial [Planctomycetota bacterium]